MPDRTQKTQIRTNDGDSYILRFIDFEQISMVDEALSLVGEYGEVRLIVEKGRLRFVVTQKSYDALKWQPGIITEESGK